MKKGLFYLSVIVIALFLAVAPAFAKAYIVGTSADFPPFEYVEKGQIVGFDIDLIKAIAKSQGFEVNFQDISFDSLIPGLNAGTIDIVASGMTITEEREKVVDFTKPYYSANQAVLVKEGSGKNITVLFGDHKLAVQTGTTGDLWVEENLEKTGILKGKVTRFDTFVLAIQDLLNGNVDGVVLDTPVALRYAAENPVVMVAEIITGEEYGFAVAKGNKELLEKLNKGLEEVKASGKMDELLKKYF